MPAPKSLSVDIAGDKAARDEALLKLAKAGDADAWREIVTRNRKRMCFVAKGILQPRFVNFVDDCVQEACQKAFTKLEGFRGQAAISTWLCTIVTNTALDFLRGNRAENDCTVPLAEDIVDCEADDTPAMHEIVADTRPDPLAVLSFMRLQQAVDALAGKFSHEERTVVHLVLQGVDRAEIAQITGLTIKRVYSITQKFRYHAAKDDTIGGHRPRIRKTEG